MPVSGISFAQIGIVLDSPSPVKLYLGKIQFLRLHYFEFFRKKTPGKYVLPLNVCIRKEGKSGFFVGLWHLNSGWHLPSHRRRLAV
jgi:hypothetical protein